MTTTGNGPRGGEGDTGARDGGPAVPGPRARGGPLVAIASIVVEIVGSIAVFYLARGLGASEFAAYVYACIPPAVVAVVGLVRERRLEGASVAIVGFNLVSAVFVVVGSHSPQALLYKDCVVTGIVGMVFLATLVVGTPLTHLFTLRFAGASAEGRARFERLWADAPGYRTAQRRTTAVWGVLWIVASCAKAVVIARLPFDTAYGITQLMPFGVVALAVGYTIVTTRRARARGERAAAATVGPPDPAAPAGPDVVVS